MTDESPHAAALAGRRPVRRRAPGRLAWPARLWSLLVSWSERHRERRHLSTLDERALRDIGLTRADLRCETEKPFWLP
jgi:uncharacterized protein YjiS (DUF1127 family)